MAQVRRTHIDIVIDCGCFKMYAMHCIICDTGKSNFMDAVSFVMGEKTNTLRVKRLSDLIHGASINKPVSRSAMVSAIFELEDGTELKFTRVVQGSSSEHRFNGEVHWHLWNLNLLILRNIYFDSGGPTSKILSWTRETGHKCKGQKFLSFPRSSGKYCYEES